MKEDMDDIEDMDDDSLYASYEAYKTLLDAGLSKKEALMRTGLTAQIVKDLEDEESEMDLRSEFKEVWDEDSDDYVGDSYDSDDEDFQDDSWGSDDDEYGSYEDKDYY